MAQMAAPTAEEVILAEPAQPAKKRRCMKFLILLLVYTIFLLLGAAMFMHLEFTEQEQITVNDFPEWLEIKGSLGRHSSLDENLTQEEVAQAQWLQLRCPHLDTFTLLSLFHIREAESSVSVVEQQCGDFVQNVTVTQATVYSWSFIDALYFSMTVITTIGYGHIAPTTPAGKVACMIYATFGVPFTGILLAHTSDVFGEKVYAIYKSKLSGQKQRSRVFIVSATVLYLLLGFVVFLFLPAIVFVFVEGWSYLDSIYYAFITLTTIGFGDLVSGRNMEPGVGNAFYQLFVIVWIISSLGYWVMVANFITRALRSKKLHASLIHRAKLLKEIMDKQSDPVFLPQRSKYTMNFMMQLSSMLAVDPEVAQELHLSDSHEAPPLRETKARSTSMPMGIPGIASLFNMPQASPSGFNTQICKSVRRLDGGQWLTGSTEKPHKRKGLTSPVRMCLMGGGLACATLLLTGAQVPSQPSSKRSSLFRMDSSFPGMKRRRSSIARVVFGRSSSPHASLGHVYELCPQQEELSEERIYELLTSHPDDVIILSTPDNTVVSDPNSEGEAQE